jgi:hypothetical protein
VVIGKLLLPISAINLNQLCGYLARAASSVAEVKVVPAKSSRIHPFFEMSSGSV